MTNETIRGACRRQNPESGSRRLKNDASCSGLAGILASHSRHVWQRLARTDAVRSAGVCTWARTGASIGRARGRGGTWWSWGHSHNRGRPGEKGRQTGEEAALRNRAARRRRFRCPDPGTMPSVPGGAGPARCTIRNALAVRAEAQGHLGGAGRGRGWSRWWPRTASARPTRSEDSLDPRTSRRRCWAPGSGTMRVRDRA